MRKVMTCLIANLDREISLSELAKQMYVSASTLSRLFKKNTGEYFADFLLRLRVKNTLSALQHTDQSLTQVALAAGFSNSATFSRAFRRFMKMTPSRYRELQKEQSAKKAELKEEEAESIRRELKSLGFEERQSRVQETVALSVSSGSGMELKKKWSRTINIGGLFELTRANVQRHIRYLQDMLHVEYIRTWNVFSRRMMITDGKSGGTFNFDLVLQALDFLVQNRLKVFLDFGRRPDTAVGSAGDVIFCNEDMVPFRTRELWEKAVETFLHSLVVRYGMEEVSGWIFELSRYSPRTEEEGRLYEEGEFSFFSAYRYLYGQIRAIIPGAEFGGTDSSISLEGDMLKGFAKRCIKEDCVPDYLAFTLFPFHDVQAAGDRQAAAAMRAEMTEEEQVNTMCRILTESGLSAHGTKLYITEWNNTISNRNFLNDSCFRSSYMAGRLCRLSRKVDDIAVMCGTDWISSYMDTVGVVNGGTGLLTKDMIRKPAFFALAFMNELGGEILAAGEHCLVTRKSDGNLTILCWYFSWLERSYELQKKGADLKAYRDRAYADETPLSLRLELSGLTEGGAYLIKRQALNRKSGSILDEWGQFDYDTWLTRADIQYLNAVCTPALSQHLEKSPQKGEVFCLDIELMPQEVSLIHLVHRL